MPEETSQLRASLEFALMEIADSQQFAYRVHLAHELGLLEPLIAGQWEELQSASSRLLSSLAEGQFPQHRQVLALLDKLSSHPGIQSDGTVGSPIEMVLT